jgi:thymidylate kinase
MGIIKKPVLVEFNGLPGSGKTTVANLLYSRFEAAGYNVDQRENTYLINRFGSLGRKWRMLKSGGIVLPWRLFNFYLSIEPVTLERLHQIKRIYAWTSSYTRLYRDGGRGWDVVLVSEGFVQAVVSAVFIDDFGKKKELQDLLNYFLCQDFNIVIVDCVIDEGVAAERILNRKGIKGRFDNMSVTHLEGNLAIHNRNLEIVRKNLRYMGCPETVRIDMDKPPEENCELIYRVVESRIRRGVVEIPRKGGGQRVKTAKEGLP